MKKMKMSLPLLALITGVLLSAFTLRPHRSAASHLDALYWFTVDGSNNPDSYDGNGLQIKDDEKTITGCNNTVPTECRFGYTSSQLNFSGGTPVSVKQVSPGVYETRADHITKSSN